MTIYKAPQYQLLRRRLAFHPLTVFLMLFFALPSISQITLQQSIGDNITPKSIVTDGRGLFSAQNMMYKHTISLYSAKGVLLKTITDGVNLNKFGFTEYDDALYRGAPVEACFTPDGKYLWVSNYAMYGPGFNKEGCDGCSGDDYDPSFLYKINTLNYQIESVVRVGSVPKFLTISDNGKLLLVSNWTSSDVSIIDLEAEKEIKRVKVGLRPRGIVLDQWNQKAYVAVMGSDKIAVINLLNYSVGYIKHIGKAPRHLILNKSNSHLFVAINSANKLAKVDLATRHVTYCETKPGPRSMVLSADEKFLYVVNYHANTFQKIDAKSMKVIETVETADKPIGITGDWQNGVIWVSCYSGKIQLFADEELPKVEGDEMAANIGFEPKIKLAGLLLNMIEIDAEKESENAITKEEVTTDLEANANQHVLNTENEAIFNSDNSVCQYSVIVGSFSILENAQHLQDLLATQNIPSTRIPSVNNHMTMVAVGCYNNSQVATNRVKILKLEHDLNAWIYRK